MSFMKQPRVAIVLFNTLARNSRFWGNMELSLLAGELEDAGISNEIFVLLMRPGEKTENLKTTEEFITILSEKKFNYLVMHASWLPWLPDMIRERTGAKVLCLDSSNRMDIPRGLEKLDAHAAVLAAVRGATTARGAEKLMEHQGEGDLFRPQFNYTFLGASRPMVQEIAFASIQSCPYRKDVRKNPLFKNVVFSDKTSTRGCSYCAGAKTYAPVSEEKKREILSGQVRYLQSELGTLKEIAVPCPEDYLEALAWIIRSAGELGIKPVTFSGQFRAGALVENEDNISDLIRAALENDFRFIISVVGLESFYERDLEYFNRDSVREVREAVLAVSRLRKTFDPEFFMSGTVGSFILFHPWQTMEGLFRNIEGMLSSQIAGLFSTININDIRIHSGVALYSLAQSEGLTSPQVERQVQEIPLGGYFAENPWKFRDRNVEAVHKLFSTLLHKTPERIGLLKCICNFVQNNHGPVFRIDRITRDLETLGELIRTGSVCRNGEDDLLLIGEKCNQACETCLFDNAAYTDDFRTALGLLKKHAVEGKRAVTIAGREPTILRWLARFAGEIKNRGPAGIQLLTNGRMLAYPGLSQALISSGTTKFMIKIHSHHPHVHDRISSVKGAFNQTMKGVGRLDALRKQYNLPLEVAFVVIVGDHNLGALEEVIDRAAGEGAGEVRFALPMGALNLGRLKETTRRLESAIRCARKKNMTAGMDPGLSCKWRL